MWIGEAKGTEKQPPERSPEDTELKGPQGGSTTDVKVQSGRTRLPQAQIPAPPLTGCVTLGK